MGTLVQVLGDPTTRAIAQDQLKKGGSSNIVEMTMKMAEPNIKAKIERNLGNREAMFTVQSSSRHR